MLNREDVYLAWQDLAVIFSGQKRHVNLYHFGSSALTCAFDGFRPASDLDVFVEELDQFYIREASYAITQANPNVPRNKWSTGDLHYNSWLHQLKAPDNLVLSWFLPVTDYLDEKGNGLSAWRMRPEAILAHKICALTRKHLRSESKVNQDFSDCLQLCRYLQVNSISRLTDTISPYLNPKWRENRIGIIGCERILRATKRKLIARIQPHASPLQGLFERMGISHRLPLPPAIRPVRQTLRLHKIAL